MMLPKFPDGHSDTFSYNGLGLRVAKTDSTGTYSYLCDGTSPASPVLSDGHAVYTPGLSERRGGSSSYYENDRLGNLWTLDSGSGKGYSAGYNFSGFGSWVYAGGSTGNPFQFGGGNGCQTGADIGLVLMGHRYYDTRIGRFISQDPAGDGDNWYTYAGNDPMDGADPSGLLTQQEAADGAAAYLNGNPGVYDFWQVTNSDYTHAKYLYSVTVGFNTNYNPAPTGIFGTNVMNFPGGSATLMRNVHTAEAAARNMAPNFRSKYPQSPLSTLAGILARAQWFKSKVHGPDKRTHIAGAWDIKEGVDQTKNPLLFSERRNAGDFMYGATGDATRLGGMTLQLFAGLAQFGDDPQHAPSYWQTGFDDPPGHGEVLAGMAWYDSGAHTYSLAVP